MYAILVWWHTLDNLYLSQWDIKHAGVTSFPSPVRASTAKGFCGMLHRRISQQAIFRLGSFADRVESLRIYFDIESGSEMLPVAKIEVARRLYGAWLFGHPVYESTYTSNVRILRHASDACSSQQIPPSCSRLSLYKQVREVNNSFSSRSASCIASSSHPRHHWDVNTFR